jgi:hypothetical protein
MIDVIDIMNQIEHMATSTQEQREEEQAEAFRLQEIADEKRRISRENHEARIMELRVLMQEIRARTPKQQIYFGKVKTE